MKEWIEFIPVPGREKVICPRCGKLIGHQRMARGAHAAWCLKNSLSPDIAAPSQEEVKEKRDL